MYTEAENIKDLVAAAQRIVVMQADNPDADSLGSALALESVLGDLGKDVWLYCGVDVPSYLRYLEGWDRVTNSLPSSYDAVIVVDASTTTLFEILQDANARGIIASKPVIVLDHHAITDNPLTFAEVTLNDPTRSSTGELIHTLAKQLDWSVSQTAGDYIMTAILGDTQGLTNELATADTYRVMAELTDLGVNRPLLEEKRREAGKMQEKIYRYKGELITRTELYLDGKVAVVVVPQREINDYSPLYNPSALVQPDMLQIEGVGLSIVLKSYDSGRVTAAMRANTSAPIAGQLAEHMGGGGHKYASGFKIEDGRPLSEIKSECLSHAQELFDKLDEN